MKRTISLTIVLNMLVSLIAVPNVMVNAADGNVIGSSVDMTDTADDKWKIVAEDVTGDADAWKYNNSIGTSAPGWGVYGKYTDTVRVEPSSKSYYLGGLKYKGEAIKNPLELGLNPRGRVGMTYYSVQTTHNGRHLQYTGGAYKNFAITFDIQTPNICITSDRTPYFDFGLIDSAAAINTDLTKYESSEYVSMGDTVNMRDITIPSGIAQREITPRAAIIDPRTVDEFAADDAANKNKMRYKDGTAVTAKDPVTNAEYIQSYGTTDNGTEYINQVINCKAVADGGVMSLYMKFEDSDTWKHISSYDISSLADKEKRFYIASDACQLLISNLDIWQRESEIVTEPEEPKEEWQVVKDNVTSVSTNWKYNIARSGSSKPGWGVYGKITDVVSVEPSSSGYYKTGMPYRSEKIGNPLELGANPRGRLGMIYYSIQAKHNGRHLQYIGGSYKNFGVTFDLQFPSMVLDSGRKPNLEFGVIDSDTDAYIDLNSYESSEYISTGDTIELLKITLPSGFANGEAAPRAAIIDPRTPDELAADLSNYGPGSAVTATDPITNKEYIQSYETTNEVKYYLNQVINCKVIADGASMDVYMKFEDSDKWKHIGSYDISALQDKSKRFFIAADACQLLVSNLDIWQKTSEIVPDPGDQVDPDAPTVYTKRDFFAKDANDMISYPRFGTPAFTEPGRELTVELRTSEKPDLSADGWKLYLENKHKRWECEVTNVEYVTPVTDPQTGVTSGGIYLGLKPGYKITIKIPDKENIAYGLMSIVLRHSQDESIEYKSPQAVSIVEDLESKFYAVGTSDTHTGLWERGFQTGGEGQSLEDLNKQLEIIGARYFYNLGDLVQGGGKKDDGSIFISGIEVVEDLYADSFTKYAIPTINVLGNHDYDSYVYPNRGPRPVDATKRDVTYDEAAQMTEEELDEVNVLNNFDFDEADRIYGMRSALIPMGDNMIIAKHDFGAWGWKTRGKDLPAGAETNDEWMRGYNGTGTAEPFVLRDALAREWNKWTAKEGDGFRLIYQHTPNTGSEYLDFGKGDPYAVNGWAAFMSPTFHAPWYNSLPGQENLKDYDFQMVGHYHIVVPMGEKLLALGGSGFGGGPGYSGQAVVNEYTFDTSADKWVHNLADTVKNDPYMMQAPPSSKEGRLPEGNPRREYIDEHYHTYFLLDNPHEKPAVSDEYLFPNDGNADYNVATIKNRTDKNFYDGRVEFIMPVGSYEVEGANIISQYNSYGDKYTVVLAHVDIPEGSENSEGIATVLCKKASGNADDICELYGSETGFVAADTAYLDWISLDNTSVDDFAVSTDGYALVKDVDYSVEKINSYVDRITFKKTLVQNAKYTVKLGEAEKSFVVLPGDYIAHSQYGSNTPGNVSKAVATMSIPEAVGANWVMDVTVKMVVPASAYLRGVFTSEPGDMRFICFKPEHTDKNGNYFRFTMSGNRGFFTDNTFRGAGSWIYAQEALDGVTTLNSRLTSSVFSGVQKDFTSSIKENPINNLEVYGNYDFRFIRLGSKVSLYVRKSGETRYDHIFTFDGMWDSSVETYPGFVYINGTGGGVVSNFRVYNIGEKTVEENTGSAVEFELETQPSGAFNKLNLIYKNEAGTTETKEITVKRIDAKKYAIDLNDLLAGGASYLQIPAYTDVYGKAVGEASIDFNIDVKEDGITSVKNDDGTYTVTVPAYKYFTDGAAAILASMKGEELLGISDVKRLEVKDAGAVSLVFENVKADAENPEFKLMVWNNFKSMTPYIPSIVIRP